ncbi:LysR family transcriptional regulator [Chelatococcus asaccharovorans]|uniref:LysR family transcriptional regulator n=1 Tax=Chelatococcus asaccharovorans TaxID=28210 RepID=UPI00224C7A53|nr:LysR family transcriptional regulator [Chelatococcus asaccharovorans]CAH1653126.1 Transcriptional regulator, LysR family [Chelatococcus asaccharovorans]CAH1686137.1 Transcriptional regulator, LysR family [Chelatococcus asaccharovorans]
MFPNVTLTQLRCFSGVAEQGSFTAAADRLHLTQSAVSQNVAALEKALQARLVVRMRGELSMTAAGQRALAEVRLALSAVERLGAVTSSPTALRGALRLGVVQSAAVRLLPGWIRRLRAAHPEVTVTLYEGTDPEVLDWVLAGIAEIGIASRKHTQLEAREVFADNFVVVVPTGHPFERRGNIELAELDGQRMLMSGGGCETMIEQLLTAANCRPDVVCMVRDNTTLCGMVREGLGLTIMPELALPGDKTGLEVVALRPRLRRVLNLLSPPEAALGPIATAFAALLAGDEAHR